MAGEKLSYAEIKNWYDTFNEVITNYGGEIATLTPPAQGAKAQPNDVNNIFNKIDEFIDDEYLGTQPTLYNTDYSIVQSGTKMIRSATTPISETVTNIAQIKCRNKITYSSGSNSNGFDTNQHKSYGSLSSGSHKNGWHSNEWNTNTWHGNGIFSCGTLIDILNANTSY